MADNTLVNKIKQLSALNKVSAFLRSSNTRVELLPLSIKQQKDIIKTALDLITSPLTFANVTTDIINSNLTTKTSVSVLDKPLLLLALRSNSLGNETTVVVNEKDVKVNFKDNVDFDKQIDLSSVLLPVSLDKIEVTLKVPSLDEDYRLNAECLKALEARKPKNDDKLKDLVGEIYIYEIVKFVNSIKFLDSDKIEETLFSNLSVQQRVETLEALPMALTNKIVDTISKIRTIEAEPLKINVDNTDSSISLNSAFFSRD